MLKRVQHDNMGVALGFVIPNLIRDLGFGFIGLRFYSPLLWEGFLLVTG